MSFYFNPSQTLRGTTSDVSAVHQIIQQGLESGLTRLGTRADLSLANMTQTAVTTMHHTNLREVFRLAGTDLHVQVGYRYFLPAAGFYCAFVELVFATGVAADNLSMTGVIATYTVGQPTPASSVNTPAAAPLLVGSTSAGVLVQIGGKDTTHGGAVFWMTRLADPSTGSLTAAVHFGVVTANAMTYSVSAPSNAFANTGANSRDEYIRVMRSGADVQAPTHSFAYTLDGGITLDGLKHVSSGPYISVSGTLLSTQHPDCLMVAMPNGAGPAGSLGTIGTVQYQVLELTNLMAGFSLHPPVSTQKLWVRR